MSNNLSGLLVERAGDQTTLTIEVAYTPPLSVLGKFAEQMTLRRNRREMEFSMQTRKETLES